jgi:hypothetical protein
MMYPYPRTYPNEAVELIAQYIADKDTELQKKEVIHASWVVAGYTLGRIFGGGPAIIGSKKFKVTKAPSTPDKIKKLFDDLKKANRYGTIEKLLEQNPSCWHHLNTLAKSVLESISV